MTMMEGVVVAMGGCIGAIVRYFFSAKLNKEDGLPIGTLVVNVTGSLLLGVVFGLQLSLLWTLFLVSGLAGSLTTFSTLNKEFVLLWESGNRKAFVGYILSTYGLGLFSALIGYSVGVNV
ncbi:CrcB family protein [Sporosarcina sp. OR05]|uniref:fluoride efflux transporter FluC n=1 Tax=Sporosarcina sp. OR05 TaxID=2969819 RepID=UPI00352A6129